MAGVPRGRRGTYRSGGSRAPAKPKVPSLTINDMLGSLITSLDKQASEPNMHHYEPHEKQTVFHKSSAKQKLFKGGNRSGKTTAGVVEDLWWVTRRHPYRQIPSDVAIRGRVLGDGFDNGTINKVLIPTFKRWIIPSDLINGSWEDSWSNKDHTLTLENGSFIEFNSYDQDLQKHAGTSRHFAHFDEEPPQEIFAETMMRLVDTRGSWWMTMTPLNGMNWVNEDLYEPAMKGDLKDFLVVEVNSLDNPNIDEEVLNVLFGTLSEEEKLQRMQGEFAEKGGKVFPEFGPLHVTTGPWYPDASDGYRIYMSLDSGYNNPTAILWHAVSPENLVITFGEHYKSRMIVKDHAEAIKKFEAEHQLKIFARPADPATKQEKETTGTSPIQEYARNGIFLNVENIPRSVSIGIDKMHAYMRLSADNRQPRWIIIKDQCPNLVRELGKLSWASYATTKQRSAKNRIEEVKKKDDHAFDSSRYFFTMMPDLAPGQLWHPPLEKKVRLRDFSDVMAEMALSQRVTKWSPGSNGFSDEEYNFDDNLEMAW